MSSIHRSCSRPWSGNGNLYPRSGMRDIRCLAPNVCMLVSAFPIRTFFLRQLNSPDAGTRTDVNSWGGAEIEF